VLLLLTSPVLPRSIDGEPEEIDGTTLAIGALATTRRACLDDTRDVGRGQLPSGHGLD
jgi:hypothetical protein